MLWFSIRSIFTKYGWSFIRYIALPHPARTLKALYKARQIKSEDTVSISAGRSDVKATEPLRSIVGVGFCMKPKKTQCPSLKDLHGCEYLEKYYPDNNADIPEACKECYIKDIGIAALKSNRAFYIMTSARDILFDVFKPAIDNREFEYGNFILCRYSFKPFFVGMYISGINGKMYPFYDGDCRDYKKWIKADRGEKDERTKLDLHIQTEIEKLLSKESCDANRNFKIDKRGNVFIQRREGG